MKQKLIRPCRSWAALFAALLLVPCLASASDPPPPPNPHGNDPAFAEPGYYIIQPGDTCLDVAKRAWPDDPGALDRLHDLNDMGPLPHNLVAGMRLRIISTTPDATVTFVKPDVNVRKAGKAQWANSRLGEGLFNLDQLSTLTGAAASLLFRDKSTLQLDQNALITVYESAANTRKQQRSGAIELVQGDLRLHLAEIRGEKGAMDVKTPAAHVSAAGATLAVDVDEKKMSRVSVFDGMAAVAANGETVDVKHGFGTRVAEGAKPEPPQQLPPAPAWAIGGARDVLMALPTALPDGKIKTAAPLLFMWDATPSAVRYRLEMATDDQFNARLIDRYFDSKDARSFSSEAAVGTYFARVSAFNAAGLVGTPSVTKQIEVKKLTIESGIVSPKKPGTLIGAVEIRLRLPEGTKGKVFLDGIRFDGNPVVIRGLGAHKLTLNIEGQKLSYDCEVQVPRAKLAFTHDLKHLVIQFFDAQGHPAAFLHAPDVLVGLKGLEGTGVVEPEPVGDGHEWRADIRPHRYGATQLSAEVELYWGGQYITGGAKSVTLSQ